MRRFTPLVLILLAGCGPTGDDAQPLGSKAPDVSVETLSVPSSTASLAKRQGKVVLLDFWATWCGPCRAITPVLEDIYARHKDDGLEAMAITTEAREIVALNEQKRPHAMPVYLDRTEKASRAFGAEALPTVVVVDRQGQIVYKTVGFGENTESELRAAVEKAVGQG